MPNLTEEKSLVRRLNGVAPYPDHYLVVFKRDGDGKRFRTCVSPGERFKKPIFESLESFVAFAVPGDRNLRYRFQRSYKTHDLLHNFTLHFTLDYRVSDPATLVAKLELDPLQRLEDETDLLLVQKNKSLNWSMIEREQIDLEDVLFNDPRSGHQYVEDSNLEKLSRFALTQGFEVKRVVVTRDLPDEEIAISNKQLTASRDQAILTIDHGTDELKQNFDLRLRENENSFGRRNRVADGIADDVKRAFDQATDQIRSLDDIQRAVGKVAQIQNVVLGVASGGSQPALMPPASLALAGTACAGVLPETTMASSLDGINSSISTTLGTAACNASDRRQLLSICLHIVAEALRGENASPDILSQYVGALSALSARLVPLLNSNQIKLLRNLQNTEALRQELS